MSDPVDEMASALNAHMLVSSLSKEDPTPTETPKKKEPAPKAESKPATKEAPGNFDRWTLADDSKIDYGLAGSKQKKSSDYDSSKRGFYITTAINYTNGPGHMGHAYEASTADTIARYARIKFGSDQAYFVTGSDEHGQKIANTAADATPPVQPIELCDKYVTGFQVLNQRLLVSNNDYVRTTSERHKNTARNLWEKCAANVNEKGEADIYLSKYSGWYNVREETFVTDSDAKLSDYKDPSSGKPLKKVEEESYFFRMGAYHDRLVKYIQDNPEFIQPAQARSNILARLDDDRLRDLSISRTTFDWGISVPKGFEDKHVMYVWFDALSNYLTGINALGVNGDGADNFSHHWPADVHIIGKDITWFHTVIWPCILFSAGLPLPKTVFAHGFVNDNEGIKMSKSLGNVVDPHDMLDKYPVDSFRWYLAKEAPYGGELSFSEESLMTMHNADLCDTLGNLIHRATNLCKNYCDGVVPDVPPPADGVVAVDFEKIRKEYMDKMDKFELNNGASAIMQGFRDVNGYLTEQAPWHMKGDERKEDRQIVVRATLEAVYALSHLLLPFVPNGAKRIFDKVGKAPMRLPDISSTLRNLTPGSEIKVGEVLYTKLISEEERLNAEEATKKKAEAYADAQRRKKEKKAKMNNKAAGNDNQPEFTKVEIRVGQINKVWNHPEAEKLFCEEIDVGKEGGGVRQIASGLRDFYKLSDMEGKKVLVVCNLKVSKMLGFASDGMVLAAKAADGSKVELISPPDDAKIGERVFIEGLTGEPISSTQMKKKKVFDTVSKGLVTGHGGVATWEGKVLQTSAGPCAAASIVGAPIS